VEGVGSDWTLFIIGSKVEVEWESCSISTEGEEEVFCCDAKALADTLGCTAGK
jgi:hypothetical protein